MLGAVWLCLVVFGYFCRLFGCCLVFCLFVLKLPVPQKNTLWEALVYAIFRVFLSLLLCFLLIYVDLFMESIACSFS